MSDWITLSETAGTSGTTTITVTVSSMNSGHSRNAVLKVIALNRAANVVINQTDEPTYITVYYNIPNAGRNTILHNGTHIYKMRVDGGEWIYSNYINVQQVHDYSAYTDYTFSTSGIHMIEYDTVDKKISSNNYGGPNFSYLSNIVEVNIPGAYTEIGAGTFSNSINLSSITLHEGTEIINGFNNTSITYIVVPESVTYIGANCFSDCTSLKTIKIPDSVTEVKGSCFSGCTSLENVILPSGCTNIAGAAFSGCTSLKTITLPSTLNGLGSYAFADCSSLKEIYSYRYSYVSIYEPGSPIDTGNKPFLNVGLNGILHYPAGSNYYSYYWMPNREGYLGYYGWTAVEDL